MRALLAPTHPAHHREQEEKEKEKEREKERDKEKEKEKEKGKGKGKGKEESCSASSSSSSSSSFQITGFHALLFDDDTLAAFVNSPDALLPWHGDPSLLIDRYDVRHLLQDLSGVRRRRRCPAPPLEPHVSEEDLHHERFRDLDQEPIHALIHRASREEEEEEEEEEKEEEAKAKDVANDAHLHPHLIEEPSKRGSGNVHYQAVPFSYSTEAPKSFKAEEATTKSANFVPPFPVPEFLQSKLPGSEKLHQIMVGTAKFVNEHGGQSEFLLKVKQGDNPMFGFLNSDHNLHDYYRYLVQHPELLRPGSGSHTESKNIGGEGLSLLGSAYGSGDDDDDNANENYNVEGKEVAKPENPRELPSAPSPHVGEMKSKESNANGSFAMNKIADSSKLLKGAELKKPKAVLKEPAELEKKKVLGGPKDCIPPNKTILPKLNDTKSKSKSEKENKDVMVDRSASRFEPRGSWQPVPNKEYGMSADAAAAVVLAATRGTRGIIKQDSNVSSSSGLSQRVLSNGGRQDGSTNNQETTTATAMAQAAAIAASREADSADALLTPAEKLKAERLRRAKMFAAMIKSGKCSSEIDFELPGSLGAGSGAIGSDNAGANSNEIDRKDSKLENKNNEDGSYSEKRRSVHEEVEESRVKESEHDLRGSKTKKSHRRRKHSGSDSEQDHRSGKKRSHRHHGSDKRSKQKRHDSDSSEAEDCRDGSKASDDDKDLTSYKQKRHHHSKKEHSRSKKHKHREDDRLDSDRDRKKHRKRSRARDHQSDSDEAALKKKVVASPSKESQKGKEVALSKRTESPSCLKVVSLPSDIQNPSIAVDVPADIRAKVREMLLSTL